MYQNRRKGRLKQKWEILKERAVKVKSVLENLIPSYKSNSKIVDYIYEQTSLKNDKIYLLIFLYWDLDANQKLFHHVV